ncbi:hypothetical protein TNCV_3656241 [Trichonephila clavipes]|nr:hypothetical protein TNCV_3656241 [Trichonephila clavipes]
MVSGWSTLEDETISNDNRSTLVVISNSLTANVYVSLVPQLSLVIQPIALPFMNNIQGGVFHQDNADHYCCNASSSTECSHVTLA